jgi:two-component system response regulator AtoC
MTICSDPPAVLVAEDDLEVCAYFETILKSMGYSVQIARDGEEVLTHIEAKPGVSAVLLEATLPDRDGSGVLREIRRIRPSLPVIMISAASSLTDVVAAMKSGASDFLFKPILHDQLKKAVTRALEGQPADCPAPKRILPAPARAFVGRSPRMKEIQALASQVGWSEAPVLIQGETGTGKEVLARELHALSPRAKGPFLKLNCAALPSELVESELFGYERGAFTGAFQRKSGMFEVAEGGTILLDEIGDMEVRLQAKLLQVIQDQEFLRIGGKEQIRVNVRIMAATHRDLEEAIRERLFREDLYYRLNVINIQLPALRDRKEDIIQLAEFLMRRHAGSDPIPPLTTELRTAMLTYRWPGNVRELENVVRRFLILRDADLVIKELRSQTRERLVEIKPPQTSPLPPATEPLAPFNVVLRRQQNVEAEAILAALNETRWNRKRAAGLLKMDYKALLYQIKRLRLDERPVQQAPASNNSERAPRAVAR